MAGADHGPLEVRSDREARVLAADQHGLWRLPRWAGPVLKRPAAPVARAWGVRGREKAMVAREWERVLVCKRCSNRVPLRGFRSRNVFPHSSEVRDRGVGQRRSPRPADGPLLPAPSHGLPSARVWVATSSSRWSGLAPTLTTLFHPPRDATSKFSHVVKYGGLELEHMNWGGRQRSIRSRE